MQRCLIIEGSPVIRKVTKAILSDFGFDVAEAATGRDGLILFNRHIPRLAIVDSNLTDMPALDVLRQMRDTTAGRVQILYCTTEYELVALQRAHAAGATDVLVKPFDRQSLAAKLNAWSQSEQEEMRPNFYSRLSRSAIVRIA